MATKYKKILCTQTGVVKSDYPCSYSFNPETPEELLESLKRHYTKESPHREDINSGNTSNFLVSKSDFDTGVATMSNKLFEKADWAH